MPFSDNPRMQQYLQWLQGEYGDSGSLPSREWPEQLYNERDVSTPNEEYIRRMQQQKQIPEYWGREEISELSQDDLAFLKRFLSQFKASQVNSPESRF